MSSAKLVATRSPANPTAAVVVLHGGGARRGQMAVSPTQLSVLRMVPIAQRIARAGRGDLAVFRLLNSTRGWDTRHTPVDDARWALGEIAQRYGDLPTSLVGHSLGGRAALLAGDTDQCAAWWRSTRGSRRRTTSTSPGGRCSWCTAPRTASPPWTGPSAWRAGCPARPTCSASCGSRAASTPCCRRAAPSPAPRPTSSWPRCWVVRSRAPWLACSPGARRLPLSALDFAFARASAQSSAGCMRDRVCARSSCSVTETDLDSSIR